MQFIKTFLFTFCAFADNAVYTRAVCENDSLKISCDQDSIAIQDTERLPSKTECSDDSNCYENFNKNLLPEVDRCVINLKNVQFLTNPQCVLMIVSTKDPDYLVQHVLVVSNVFHFNLKNN